MERKRHRELKSMGFWITPALEWSLPLTASWGNEPRLPHLKNRDNKNYKCMLSHFSHVRLLVPMDCGPLGSSIHGILQARILECVAILSSRGSS